jgi:hypothetical protein
MMLMLKILLDLLHRQEAAFGVLHLAKDLIIDAEEAKCRGLLLTHSTQGQIDR